MRKPIAALKLARSIIVWEDLRGVRHWQPFVMQDQTPAVTTPMDDLAAALADMSCLGQVLLYRQPYALLGGAPAPGAYQTARDALELQVACEAGEGMMVDIPGPKEDLFTGGLALNLADARVATLEAALASTAANENLKAALTIVSGRRVRIERYR